MKRKVGGRIKPMSRPNVLPMSQRVKKRKTVTKFDMSGNRRRYRKTGMWVSAASLIALIVAYKIGAPTTAVLVIGVCGLGIAAVLSLLK